MDAEHEVMTVDAYEGAADVDGWIAQHQSKDLLRLLTCGSVDDGKSTMIGRLLHDTKLVYEDQLAAAERDSIKYGTVGRERVDLALLCDGLKSEREQGITIDVAYRYFSTAKRKFIIADCPGHEQYTRNMATGASTCDLAILLVDARHGVITQTRRHAFIVSLLGIRHVVVAVNKMDLVDFDQGTYRKIHDDFTEFAARLDLPDVHFIPISALEGDNVVERSARTPWFRGAPLLAYLEDVHIASDRNLVDFRFPVQCVIRPDLDFRGFAGSIASGRVKVGDPVTVLPAGTRSTVARIVTADGDLEEAHAPQPVTICLADEIDCSRGDLVCHPGNVPRLASAFEAMVVWMDEKALRVGAPYWIRGALGYVPGTVTTIRYAVDVNSLARQAVDELALNQIARVTVEATRPIPLDAYAVNRVMGSFVLVDRSSHATAGAGMVRAVQPVRDPVRQLAGAAVGGVDGAERARLLGHAGRVVWITGLPCSGKGPLATALERACFDRGILASVLRGSALRRGLSADLGFSPEDRDLQVRRLAHVAALMADAGLVVAVASVSPARAARVAAREIVGSERFVEVHASADAAWCAAHDTSGIWAAARDGLVHGVPGHDADYEPPARPDVDFPADADPAVTAADIVARFLKS